MKKEEIVPNVGDSADISGHESLSRKAPNELVVHMDGYHWLIQSTMPITVTQSTMPITVTRHEDD